MLRVVAGEKLYVAEMLQKLAGTEFATQEGTLYPLLSRLRREQLVDYEWQESDAGPPRKYYKLTEPGREALHELQGYWNHLNETLTRLGN
ncbi:MAG: PadR family transcriptional regulator [Steroidobacteraceae bacterium]